MHVVTGCVIRDRVWIIRGDKGPRRESEMAVARPAWFTGPPCSLKLSPLPLPFLYSGEIESWRKDDFERVEPNKAKLIRGSCVLKVNLERGGSVPRNNTSRWRVHDSHRDISWNSARLLCHSRRWKWESNEAWKIWTRMFPSWPFRCYNNRRSTRYRSYNLLSGN